MFILLVRNNNDNISRGRMKRFILKHAEMMER